MAARAWWGPLLAWLLVPALAWASVGLESGASRPLDPGVMKRLQGSVLPDARDPRHFTHHFEQVDPDGREVHYAYEASLQPNVHILSNVSALLQVQCGGSSEEGKDEHQLLILTLDRAALHAEVSKGSGWAAPSDGDLFMLPTLSSGLWSGKACVRCEAAQPVTGVANCVERALRRMETTAALRDLNESRQVLVFETEPVVLDPELKQLFSQLSLTFRAGRRRDGAAGAAGRAPRGGAATVEGFVVTDRTGGRSGGGDEVPHQAASAAGHVAAAAPRRRLLRSRKMLQATCTVPSDCDEGQFCDASGICNACDPTCTTCIGAGRDQCLKCSCAECAVQTDAGTECVECKTDANCEAGKWCDRDGGSVCSTCHSDCATCAYDEEEVIPPCTSCKTDTNKTVLEASTGQCVECTQDSDCESRKVCNRETPGAYACVAALPPPPEIASTFPTLSATVAPSTAPTTPTTAPATPLMPTQPNTSPTVTTITLPTAGPTAASTASATLSPTMLPTTAPTTSLSPTPAPTTAPTTAPSTAARTAAPTTIAPTMSSTSFAPTKLPGRMSTGESALIVTNNNSAGSEEEDSFLGLGELALLGVAVPVAYLIIIGGCCCCGTGGLAYYVRMQRRKNQVGPEAEFEEVARGAEALEVVDPAKEGGKLEEKGRRKKKREEDARKKAYEDESANLEVLPGKSKKKKGKAPLDDAGEDAAVAERPLITKRSHPNFHRKTPEEEDEERERGLELEEAEEEERAPPRVDKVAKKKSKKGSKKHTPPPGEDQEIQEERHPEERQPYHQPEVALQPQIDDEDQSLSASFGVWNDGEVDDASAAAVSRARSSKLPPLEGGPGSGASSTTPSRLPSPSVLPGIELSPPKARLTREEEDLLAWLKEQCLDSHFEAFRENGVHSIEDVIYKVDSMMLTRITNMSRTQASILLSSIKMQKMLIHVHRFGRM